MSKKQLVQTSLKEYLTCNYKNDKRKVDSYVFVIKNTVDAIFDDLDSMLKYIADNNKIKEGDHLDEYRKEEGYFYVRTVQYLFINSK